MTLEQIKGAVDLGLPVKWSNSGYDVVCDSLGQYLIRFNPTGYCFGLCNARGELNGDESQFYIARD